MKEKGSKCKKRWGKKSGNFTEKAFKVWINSQLESHLGDKAPKVDNIDTDLGDGTVLIELLSAVYKIPKPNYNKNPQLQVQCLDNASIVLTMLESAGIKDHFIGPKSLKTIGIFLTKNRHRDGWRKNAPGFMLAGASWHSNKSSACSRNCHDWQLSLCPYRRWETQVHKIIDTQQLDKPC